MRAAVVLAALILAAGCRLGGPWPEEEIPELEYRTQDVSGIVRWVRSHMQSLTDEDLYGVPGYWATPLETYAAGGGDCEDLSILALYLIERDLGIDGALVGGEHPRNKGHGWLRVADIDYDPMVGGAVSSAEDDYTATVVFGWELVKDLIGI